jgi:hypothetical protein
MFNQTTIVQTPSSALIHQAFTADPLVQTVGPYAAGTPDVDPVLVSRQIIMVVPNRYAAPFLSTGMALKQAFLALEGMIQHENQEIACAALLDWLHLTLTLRAGAQQSPITCTLPLTGPIFYSPLDQQDFLAYRISILHHDFPQLHPGQLHNSAVLIAQGLSDLTSKQRIARPEAQQQRILSATPRQHLPSTLASSSHVSCNSAKWLLQQISPQFTRRLPTRRRAKFASPFRPLLRTHLDT